jgi:hypothetical protein
VTGDMVTAAIVARVEGIKAGAVSGPVTTGT